MRSLVAKKLPSRRQSWLCVVFDLKIRQEIPWFRCRKTYLGNYLLLVINIFTCLRPTEHYIPEAEMNLFEVWQKTMYLQLHELVAALKIGKFSWCVVPIRDSTWDWYYPITPNYPHSRYHVTNLSLLSGFKSRTPATELACACEDLNIRASRVHITPMFREYKGR